MNFNCKRILNNSVKSAKLLVFSFFVFCAGEVFSQTQQIQLPQQQLTIEEIFKQIERQTQLSVGYNNGKVADIIYKKVSVSSGKLQTVLEKALEGTGLTFSFKGNHIVILSDENGTTVVKSGEKKKIEGHVADVNGEPIIGATIMEKGTTNGTITDFDGKFVLNVAEGAPIEISYIGYQSQHLTASAGKPMSVVLKEDAEVLDEVVVVGYGTQKKVNLTGAVAAVSADDIKDRVQSNVLSAVQGTVPGVTIISKPGKTPEINFRGRGNLGVSEPLYVIDGAIADATFFSNLDPNSIESISFLKDAASSSIYGSRAAFGVVLVTTKSGKKEKINVSYSGMVGLKTPTYMPDVLDSWDYATLLNEARYNANPGGGKNQAYTEAEIQKFRDGSDPDNYPNTKWMDLILNKVVFTTQHSLNFSGGSDKVRFFAGLGYLTDGDFIPGKGSSRYNLDMNVQADVTKWLTLKTGVKYIRNTSHSDNGVPEASQFVLVPTIMVAKQSNGEWGSIAGGKDASQEFILKNPLRTLSFQDWTKNSTENSMYNIGFDLKPIDKLVISGQLDYRRAEIKNKSYTAQFEGVKSFKTGVEIPGTSNSAPNSMEMLWKSSGTLLTTLMARYDLTLGVHSLNLLAGTSYEYDNFERHYSKRTDFASDGLQDIEMGNNFSKEVPWGYSIYESKMLSYFGRINYSLMDRYLFEANLRADASSRFYKNSRWGVFPSFSVGWRISEESFLKSVKWINNLKLRASYGTLGNTNNVGYYDYYQLLTGNSYYNFNDTPVQGVAEAQIANTQLGWETVALTDIGLDMDLFDNKLSITADYYMKTTSNILLGYNVPKETGIWTKPELNLAEVKNSGFEMAVTHRNTIGDFSYSVTANISTNKNKITNLAGSDNMIDEGGDNINFIMKEGEAIGSFYGFKTDGLYTQEEIDAGRYYIFGRKPNAGDLKYVPQREGVKYYCDLAEGEDEVNASITDADRTVIGKDVPDFTYGLNIDLQWKNWELSMFGQGIAGTKVAFESEQVFAFMLNSNPRKYHLQRWTEENPNPYAPVPRLYGGTSLDEYNKYFSDNQLFNSSYFRIKTISLGYMVPQKVVTKWGISSLKFFLTGENLFTLRGDKIMKDFDPESTFGRDFGDFGIKSVAFGVNLSF